MSRCVCNGLGVYVDWNEVTSVYEVRWCEDHELPEDPRDQENAIEAKDRAARRVDEALEAVADIRDILWPNGRPRVEPGALDEIENALAFLDPTRNKEDTDVERS